MQGLGLVHLDHGRESTEDQVRSIWSVKKKTVHFQENITFVTRWLCQKRGNFMFWGRETSSENTVYDIIIIITVVINNDIYYNDSYNNSDENGRFNWNICKKLLIMSINQFIAVIIHHNPSMKSYGIKVVHVQPDILHESFDFLRYIQNRILHIFCWWRNKLGHDVMISHNVSCFRHSQTMKGMWQTLKHTP
jgi:hypothetical protein